MSMSRIVLCTGVLLSLAACGAHGARTRSTCPVKCFGIQADASRGEVPQRSRAPHADHHWVALASDSECRARGGATL